MWLDLTQATVWPLSPAFKALPNTPAWGTRRWGYNFQREHLSRGQPLNQRDRQAYAGRKLTLAKVSVEHVCLQLRKGNTLLLPDHHRLFEEENINPGGLSFFRPGPSSTDCIHSSPEALAYALGKFSCWLSRMLNSGPSGILSFSLSPSSLPSLPPPLS